MRIGIEAQRIFRSNKHGMDFVVLEVIKELQKIDKENDYFIFVAPGDDICLKESDNVHIKTINCPSYPLWEQIALPYTAKKYNLDILHCTSNTAPLYCRVPIILTLHDIIFLEAKQQSNKSTYQNLGRIYRRLIVPNIIDRCRKIITVSNFEKGRIQQQFGFPDSKIAVIYNGYSEHFKKIADTVSVTAKYIDTTDYIFFLGNTDPKKNVPGTLKAYSIYLQKSAKKMPLLIADISYNALNSILCDNGIENIRDKIICSGYISNKDLPYIYNGAYSFLYTSYRESFGIPLLESMACGTPVITGNSSALPEIAGSRALMVDVTNPENIANAMLKLENDKNFYNSVVEYGLNRAKLFSWEHTAKELLQLYKECI